jgi:hypothetical protein
LRFFDTVLKIWAVGALVIVVSWTLLYLVLQALGGDETSFIIVLSTGAVVTLTVLVLWNSLKKRL